MILHGYFRSTASWRVRIALGLKGLQVRTASYRLREGEQRAAAYLALNPQGLLPALELDDGTIITQSLAIIDYIDQTYPEPPLLPMNPIDRAMAQSIAMAITCDIHPVQNLKVLGRVNALADEAASTAWARQTIEEGLAAVEQLIGRRGGTFCVGNAPSIADLCLIPQLGNAQRFGVEVHWPRIVAVQAACSTLAAFADAVPSLQLDAE